MSIIETLSHDAMRLDRPVLLSGRFADWRALRRQRAQLSRLDSDALRDIGISPKDATKEARRPFWDVPQSWQK